MEINRRRIFMIGLIFIAGNGLGTLSQHPPNIPPGGSQKGNDSRHHGMPPGIMVVPPNTGHGIDTHKGQDHLPHQHMPPPGGILIPRGPPAPGAPMSFGHPSNPPGGSQKGEESRHHGVPPGIMVVPQNTGHGVNTHKGQDHLPHQYMPPPGGVLFPGGPPAPGAPMHAGHPNMPPDGSQKGHNSENHGLPPPGVLINPQNTGGFGKSGDNFWARLYNL